jgi:endonuclease YncB( thermonuclease family)
MSMLLSKLDFKKRASLTLTLVLMLALPDAGLSWMGKAIGVVRPDEIRVMNENGKTENVRLYGIDSPVEPQDFGRAAHLYTSNRVLWRVVEVRPLFRDHFDRLIAWVFLGDGECLNRELLRKGMAWWYKKYLPFEKELELLEGEARKARIGLWSGDSPMPPWEYQALPGGGPENISKKASPIRRGQVREKILSETGSPKRVIGDAGSVRKKLMAPQQTEQEK